MPDKDSTFIKCDERLLADKVNASIKLADKDLADNEITPMKSEDKDAVDSETISVLPLIIFLPTKAPSPGLSIISPPVPLTEFALPPQINISPPCELTSSESPPLNVIPPPIPPAVIFLKPLINICFAHVSDLLSSIHTYKSLLKSPLMVFIAVSELKPILLVHT